MDIRISVIIPVFNDSKGLEETLKALLHQNYPEEFFEIIVVDNGSTDSTFEKAGSIGNRHPGRIKVFQEKGIQGSYAARNRGIDVARGGLICFIDANIVMDREFLRSIDDYFENKGVDYLGCNVKIYSDHKTLSAKYQKLRAFKVQWYIENRNFAPTCCLSVRRSVIDQVGPFDSRLESGGDWEFGRRVHAAGFSQAFTEKIAVFHPARWRYRDLVKKNKRCARGEAQLNFYFPDDFEDIHQKMVKLRKYLPERPGKTNRECREKEIEVNLSEALLLSCFHVPLNIIKFFSYRIELNRLLKFGNLQN